ncbi:E3 ubiquitin-protein ligase synoviolin [Friedmanniomyces endolithicus]|nr:E3 ubiquitin-protein ligase synoviolin [Friedmanniomyces endolithicus]
MGRPSSISVNSVNPQIALVELLCTHTDYISPTSADPTNPIADAGPSNAATRTSSLPDRSAPPSPSVTHRCVIDLEDIAPGEAYALPCGHVFHTECIKHWLGQSDSCPTCRMDVHAFDRFWNEDTDELAYWPRGWSGFFVDISDAASETGSQAGWSPGSNIANASGPSSPTDSASQRRDSASGTVRLPVQLLAFHRHLISELETLRVRANLNVAMGVEILLNRRWADFVLTEIRAHEASAQFWEEFLREY